MKMSNRLQVSEWWKARPMNPGEQANIVHCKPGKSKLYIKRLEDNTGWVAFCHHCGGSSHHFDNKGIKGVFTGSVTEQSLENKDFGTRSLHIGDVSINESASMMCGRYYDLTAKQAFNDSMHSHIKGNITIDNQATGARVDNSKIVTPVGSYNSIDGHGYSIRYSYAGWTGPKYITRQVEHNSYINMSTPGIHTGRDGPMLVLTEDFWSAMAVRHAGDYNFHSMYLGGTSIHPRQLQSIASWGFNKVLVWLDNDNPQVVANSMKIRQKLEAIGMIALSISVVEEPKDLYNIVIRNTINARMP
jgi:hypothetical protein